MSSLLLACLRVSRTESNVPVCAGQCCQGGAAVASESHPGPSRHWQDSHQCHPGLPASKARPRPGKSTVPNFSAVLPLFTSQNKLFSAFLLPALLHVVLCTQGTANSWEQLKAEIRSAQAAVQILLPWSAGSSLSIMVYAGPGCSPFQRGCGPPGREAGSDRPQGGQGGCQVSGGHHQQCGAPHTPLPGTACCQMCKCKTLALVNLAVSMQASNNVFVKGSSA